MLLFLLLVAAIAPVGGLWPGLVAAIGGFVLVNWFFIEPHHTFTIAQAEDVLALLVFLGVGAIVSSFVALAARRAAEGARARAEAEALSRLGGSSPVSAVLPAALHSIGVPDGAVEIDVPDALPCVLADRGLLERALANVISNAVRFSPPGKPARVSAGLVDGIVDVPIVDRGPGVSRAERNRLFKPFQRFGDSGQGQGVGLGPGGGQGLPRGDGRRDRGRHTPGGGLTIVARLQAADPELDARTPREARDRLRVLARRIGDLDT